MIGEVLKNEREQQGLTLKDVEHGTSIRSAYIDAIEREDFAALPGEVYTRGFVRNYANFLKLNSEEVVIQFKIDYAAVMKPSANEEVPTKSTVGRLFRRKKSQESLQVQQSTPTPIITTTAQTQSQTQPRFQTQVKAQPVQQIEEKPKLIIETPRRSENSEVTASKSEEVIKIDTESQVSTADVIPAEHVISESAAATQELIQGKIPDPVPESIPEPTQTVLEPVVEQVEVEPVVEEKIESIPTPLITTRKEHKVETDEDMSLPNDQIRIEVEESSSWKKVAAAAILLLAVGGGYYLMNSDNNEVSKMVASVADKTTDISNATDVEKDKTEVKTLHSSEENVKSTPKTTESDSPRTAITSTAQASAKSVEIQAKLSDVCWLSVVADGEVVYEGTAKAGTVLDWKAEQKLSITAGNAGAVEFFKDGVSVGKAGSPGDVVEKVFTR